MATNRATFTTAFHCTCFCSVLTLDQLMVAKQTRQVMNYQYIKGLKIRRKNQKVIAVLRSIIILTNLIVNGFFVLRKTQDGKDVNHNGSKQSLFLVSSPSLYFLFLFIFVFIFSLTSPQFPPFFIFSSGSSS